MRRRMFFYLMMLVVVLAFAVHPYGARGQAADPSAHALYLPQIFSQRPVRLEQVRLTGGRAGNVILLGEVINLTSSPVYSVTVEARFYQGPDLVATVTGSTLLNATLPGQFNLFWIDGPQFNPGAPAYSYQVTVKSWETHSPVDYRAATIVSAEICDVNGFSNNFCVELRNDHARELRAVRILVWSARFAQYTVWQPVSMPTLAPGQVALFRVAPPYGASSWAEDTRATAQGELVP